jgi:hypothetical protein
VRLVKRVTDGNVNMKRPPVRTAAQDEENRDTSVRTAGNQLPVHGETDNDQRPSNFC